MEVEKEEVEVEAEAEVQETKRKTNKRKRKPVKKLGPLEKLIDPQAWLNVQEIIQNINSLPSEEKHSRLNKVLTDLQSRKSSQDFSLILKSNQRALELKAVKWMVECLAYYEEKHGFKISEKDKKIMKTSTNRLVIQKLYNHYLMGIEERHGYFAKNKPDYIQEEEEEGNPRKRAKIEGKTEVPSPSPSPSQSRSKSTGPSSPASKSAVSAPILLPPPARKLQPYNLFVQNQWKERREEFKKLGAKKVISLLSLEWKEKQKSKEKEKEKDKEKEKTKKEKEEEEEEEEDEEEQEKVQSEKTVTKGSPTEDADPETPKSKPSRTIALKPAKKTKRANSSASQHPPVVMLGYPEDEPVA